MRVLVQTPPSRVYLSAPNASPRAGEVDRGLRASSLFVLLIRENASAHGLTRKRVRALEMVTVHGQNTAHLLTRLEDHSELPAAASIAPPLREFG